MQIIPASNIACPWRVKTVELCTCWLGKGMSFLADFFKPRLPDSHTTVVIPFDDRVLFVRLLHCAQLSSRHSEVAQTLDAISGVQFPASGGFLARSELRVAPRCDSSGCEVLRSLGVSLLIRLIFRYPKGLCFTPSSARSVQHRLGKQGSADPNCSVLTTNLEAGSG